MNLLEVAVRATKRNFLANGTRKGIISLVAFLLVRRQPPVPILKRSRCWLYRIEREKGNTGLIVGEIITNVTKRWKMVWENTSDFQGFFHVAGDEFFGASAGL